RIDEPGAGHETGRVEGVARVLVERARRNDGDDAPAEHPDVAGECGRTSPVHDGRADDPMFEHADHLPSRRWRSQQTRLYAPTRAVRYSFGRAARKPAAVQARLSTTRLAATGQPRVKPKNGPKSRVAAKPVKYRPGQVDWRASSRTG